MTTANEPSVAELPLCACDELYGSHHPDCPVRAVITRLERRCAEMETLVRRHVAREKRIKLLGETHSFPEIDSDEYKELLAERESIFECARALLPPERRTRGRPSRSTRGANDDRTQHPRR